VAAGLVVQVLAEWSVLLFGFNVFSDFYLSSANRVYDLPQYLSTGPR